MSNIVSTRPKARAPRAAPDGNAIASVILGITSLTLGILSITVLRFPPLGLLPFTGSVLAVILGSASIGNAYKRGERGGTIATAGANLGWIGVYFPVVFFAFLAIFGGKPWMGVPAFVFLGISVLLAYYTWPKNRR